MILLGLRFGFYFTSRDVKPDFTLDIALLFLNLILSGNADYSVNFIDIFVFFIGSAGVAVFFNLKSLEIRGFDPRYRFGFLLIFSLAVATLVLAFIVGLPLESGLIQVFANLIHKIYLILADIFLWIVYSFLWILRPLFSFISGLKFSRPERTMNEERPFGQFEELTRKVSESGGIDPTFVKYGLWALLCLVLFVVLFFVIRKLSHNWKQNSSNERVTQETESLFSFSMLNSRVKSQLKSIQAGFRGHGIRRWRGRYNEEVPRSKIRWTYFRFAWKLKDLLPFNQGNTPKEYVTRLRANLNLPEICSGLQSFLIKLSTFSQSSSVILVLALVFLRLMANLCACLYL